MNDDNSAQFSLTRPEDIRVIWRPRGSGYGGGEGYIDLLSGEVGHTGPDLSGFVQDRVSAYLVAALFGGRAYIDYRPSEPNWIQVKVMCHDRDVLDRLHSAVHANNRVLTHDIIVAALNPLQFPTGGE